MYNTTGKYYSFLATVLWQTPDVEPSTAPVDMWQGGCRCDGHGREACSIAQALFSPGMFLLAAPQRGQNLTRTAPALPNVTRLAPAGADCSLPGVCARPYRALIHPKPPCEHALDGAPSSPVTFSRDEATPACRERLCLKT